MGYAGISKLFLSDEPFWLKIFTIGLDGDGGGRYDKILYITHKNNLSQYSYFCFR